MLCHLVACAYVPAVSQRLAATEDGLAGLERLCTREDGMGLVPRSEMTHALENVKACLGQKGSMAKTWVANILVQSTCVKCVLHAFTVGIASGQVLLAPDALLAAYCSVLFFVKQAQICNACHLATARSRKGGLKRRWFEEQDGLKHCSNSKRRWFEEQGGLKDKLVRRTRWFEGQGGSKNKVSKGREGKGGWFDGQEELLGQL
eukprot:1161866-Pelagomonas_calceolata.AAC.8